MSKEELVGGMKVGSSLSCSDCEIVELKTLRGASRAVVV